MKIFRRLKSIAIISFLALTPRLAGAQSFLEGEAPQAMNTQTEAMRKGAGFKVMDPQTSIGYVISRILSAFFLLLGIIFIVLIILAGYKWMTAGGDSVKVNEAKSSIQKAVIGLIIILAAYAITNFVFKSMDFIYQDY